MLQNRYCDELIAFKIYLYFINSLEDLIFNP